MPIKMIHAARPLLKPLQMLLVLSRFKPGAVQAFAAEKSAAGRLDSIIREIQRPGKQTRILLLSPN
jgi:hypothetical protein